MAFVIFKERQVTIENCVLCLISVVRWINVLIDDCMILREIIVDYEWKRVKYYIYKMPNVCKWV